MERQGNTVLAPVMIQQLKYFSGRGDPQLKPFLSLLCPFPLNHELKFRGAGDRR